MRYQKAKPVYWHPIGANGQEALIVLEEEDIRMYLIDNQCGTAIWSRLAAGSALDEIKSDLQQASTLDASAASAMVDDFVRSLIDRGLIEPRPDRDENPSGFDLLVEWPATVAKPSIADFDVESVLPDEAVAIGSFSGGQNNIGGSGMCTIGAGGRENIGGGPLCKPGLAGKSNISSGPPCW